MGSVRRKTFTKPLPDRAELFTRKGETFAKWKDAGKTRTAPVVTDENGLPRLGADGAPRITLTASTYTAKYRDGAGFLVEVATGCRDKTAAEQFLANLERQTERVLAGVATATECKAVEHQQAGIAGHFAAFLDHRKARGRCCRPDETLSQLTRVADACGFTKLADVNAAALERWLSVQAENGTGAARRNKYRATWVAFCNWAVRSGRLLTNPLVAVAKADEAADVRRQRRALTEAELLQLLDVARRRPLLDAATVRRGKHRGEVIAELRPETVARLELLGRERALVYKTLVLTGLRKGELASITVGQLDLDADPAYLTLDAADEKNREGNSIPLRHDLAADLRQWLADMAQARQDAASNAPTLPFDSRDQNPAECVTRNSGGRKRASYQECSTLPPDTPLFTVPAGLVRILDRDLKAAGIPKRDDRGRTVDVHALRHSFGTLLSAAGVYPRTAQAAMRHSKIDLTMNTYTDPRLLDVAGAVELLPDLPLDAGDRTGAETTARVATGTDGGTVDACPSLAPPLAPNSWKLCKSVVIAGDSTAETEPAKKGENPQFSLGKRGFSGVSRQWAMQGSNLRPLPCKGEGSPSDNATAQRVTATLPDACPTACPTEAENRNADGSPDGTAERRQDGKSEGTAGTPVDLERLAATLAGLAPGDRARLAAMLAGER
jgi:integrase